jgi:hypothetical protein
MRHNLQFGQKPSYEGRLRQATHSSAKGEADRAELDIRGHYLCKRRCAGLMT